MAKSNTAQTVLTLGIMALLFYLFRAQISAVFAKAGTPSASGVPVIASFAGAPTYGYAAGTNPLASVFTDSIFVPGETSSSQNQNPLGLDTGNLQSGILFTS
jgi:hypothetical protein